MRHTKGTSTRMIKIDLYLINVVGLQKFASDRIKKINKPKKKVNDSQVKTKSGPELKSHSQKIWEEFIYDY